MENAGFFAPLRMTRLAGVKVAMSCPAKVAGAKNPGK
jgi:hypothetical protein